MQYWYIPPAPSPTRPRRAHACDAREAGASRRGLLRGAALGVAMLCGAGVAAPALAAHHAVSVHDAWIRWLPAGLPAGGYMRLVNHSSKPMALVNADSPRYYSSVMLHESVRKAGVMSMTSVDSVPIAAHASLRFEPGGYHIMLLNPKRRIRPGDVVPVTLRFADGSQVTARFHVRKSGAGDEPSQADEGAATGDTRAPVHEGSVQPVPTHSAPLSEPRR